MRYMHLSGHIFVLGRIVVVVGGGYQFSMLLLTRCIKNVPMLVYKVHMTFFL
jgi:hypothetical protein